MNLEKTIQINGTSNRYMIKKVMRENVNASKKKRLVSESWDFSYNDQLKMINDLDETNTDFATKAIIQQINNKLSGYKQQDRKKNVFVQETFIDAVDVIETMRECDLKCRYCLNEMYVLYDIVRENKQWTVDRIDNDRGHNRDNYHLACLECNLKRRRISDDKFLFTTQMKIVKHD